MAAGLFAAFFLSALYMQLVLGYTPLEVGFAYLPQTLVWGGVSLFLSDKLVMRYGIRMPIVLGFPAFALGILLFARAPVDGNYFVDMLPAMVLQGFGAGIAFNPLLLAAMGDVEPQDSGLASGVVNTAFMMGGALGLAILASVADSRTDSLRSAGEGALEALNGGYHLAFLIGAVFAAGAALVGAVFLRPQKQPHAAGAPAAAEA
jgi:MFS family permease